ncbi:hypothetical protein BCR42DRAFT_444394 [Absidia repens]|uniref:Uncharacterized protein n=1 Tax=Absidia repens TaxID=90262 RepID=A0A1X2HRE9_9FUNG|nr:hypothetical protein BCR42DRAFT_444394 [Absidia repens]
MWSNSVVQLKPTLYSIGNVVCRSSGAAEDETLFTFFKFDFVDPACSATLDNNNNNNNALTKAMGEMDLRQFPVQPCLPSFTPYFGSSTQPANLPGDDTEIQSQQKCFYSILPLSDYKYKLVSKNKVDQCHITTMVSVTLKLLEFMTSWDKLDLFLCRATNKRET